MPNPKQMETRAREQARMPNSSTGLTPDQPPEEWWQNVLADPRAAGKPWVRIERRRLSEVPREVSRVECLPCFRLVEIRKADAIRLCGPHAIWKEVAQRLLDSGCQQRTGRLEQDGCWPKENGPSGGHTLRPSLTPLKQFSPFSRSGAPCA
jgi:hypothetical protein